MTKSAGNYYITPPLRRAYVSINGQRGVKRELCFMNVRVSLYSAVKRARKILFSPMPFKDILRHKSSLFLHFLDPPGRAAKYHMCWVHFFFFIIYIDG